MFNCRKLNLLLIGVLMVIVGAPSLADAAMYVPAQTDFVLNGSVKFGTGPSEGGSNFGPELHYSIDEGRSQVNTTSVFGQGANPAGFYDTIILSSDVTADGMSPASVDYVRGSNQVFLNFRVDEAGWYQISWELGGEQGNAANHAAPVTNRFTFQTGTGTVIANPVGTPGAAFAGYNVISDAAVFYAVPGVNYDFQLNQSAFEWPHNVNDGGYASVYALVTIQAVPEPTSLAVLGAIAIPMLVRRRNQRTCA